MSESTIDVSVELTTEQAMALAQFCKRVGFSDVQVNAVDKEETHTMLDGICQVQKALAEKDFAPR